MTSNQAPGFLRQQLLIDSNVQGPVLCRTALYSAACAVYFIVILIFTESMASPGRNFGEAIVHCFDEAVYWAPGLLLLLPLVAYDMLKLTNRFAGPIFSLRREMQRLAIGQSERRLSFRDGDYWTEMADEFNVLRDELILLREFKQNAKSIGNAEASSSKLFDNSAVVEADDMFSMG
jgi:hypothetical protein